MLGEQIRQHRKRFGYTLQEFSQKTNLSVGYLSNIERDVASPTVATLDIICNALRIDYAARDGILENIAAENDQYRCTCYTMTPGFKGTVTVPAGDGKGILCYVLSGALELTMDGTAYHMEEGDTLFIRPHASHSFRQLGSEPCVTLWFYSSSLRT